MFLFPGHDHAGECMGWVTQLRAVIALAPWHDFLVPRAPEDPLAPSPAADLFQACWGCRERDDPFPGRWAIWNLIPQAFSLQVSFCGDFSGHHDMLGANHGLAYPGHHVSWAGGGRWGGNPFPIPV